jgi:hypothetical protein
VCPSGVLLAAPSIIRSRQTDHLLTPPPPQPGKNKLDTDLVFVAEEHVRGDGLGVAELLDRVLAAGVRGRRVRYRLPRPRQHRATGTQQPENESI